MLSFNRHYKELIDSEKTYLDHFLNYLNDKDINELLAVYDAKDFKQKDDEVSQEQLRNIYTSLKALRSQETHLSAAFNEPNPELWATILKKPETLYNCYIDYITVSHSIKIPSQIDKKFREIQETKKSEKYPEVGILRSILVSPAQRMPRCVLLGNDIIKETTKKLKEKEYENNEALIEFNNNMLLFVNTVIELNKDINSTIRCLDQKKAREKISGLKINKKKNLTVVTDNIFDLQILPSDEVRCFVNQLDFSTATLKEKLALEELLKQDANKELIPILKHKIAEDKIISVLNKNIDKRNTRKKKQNDDKNKLMVFLMQTLQNQRAKGLEFDMLQVYMDAYHSFAEKGCDCETFITIIANTVLEPINKIMIEENLDAITVEQLKESLDQVTDIEEEEDAEEDDDEQIIFREDDALASPYSERKFTPDYNRRRAVAAAPLKDQSLAPTQVGKRQSKGV